MLGNWKNVEELEMYLTLEELTLIIESMRERDWRNQKFAAALKGIDLEAANQEEVQTRFDAVRLRAEAKLTGKDAEVLELDEIGIDVETE